MALHQTDINNLQKSAVNFLYIFIDEKAVGLSKDIMNKRKTQIAELSKIYQYQDQYSLQQLVQIIYNSIRARYGKTPEEVLQIIYSNAVIPVGIGILPLLETESADSILAKAAERVNNLDVSVPNVGKTNIWKDILSVLEWLVVLLNRIFGSYTNPRTYAPGAGDWTYGNAPRGNSAGSNSASFTLLPLLAAGGILYYLSKNKK